MKTVKNEPVKSVCKVVPIPEHYYCKHCGAEDSGSVRYYEQVRGSALLVSLDGELEDFETCDNENFEIYAYVCDVCDMQAACIEEIFTAEPPNVEEEDD